MADVNLTEMPGKTDFEKDVENEVAFIKALEAYTLDSFKKGILTKDGLVKTEIDLMIGTYNEMLKDLATSRFDVEIFTNLILAEPNDKSHLDSKTKSSRFLLLKRKQIKIIRGQILDMFKSLKAKETT
jgi:hypothetical protein